MPNEKSFIDLIRDVAKSPAARGLLDDAAVLDIDATRLILTSDTLVEGVHFRPTDPPATIGWKLAAVNLSDLAAKGAQPLACLMNYALSGDATWDAQFVHGLRDALDTYAMPLIGGDTVAMSSGAPRSFTLTAIGRATNAPVPARAGGKAGDILYVTGPVGDSGAGLALLTAGQSEPAALIDAYRRPQPRIAQGQILAPHVHAMMDISDGLLIDAGRIAAASGLAVVIDHIPLSPAFAALHGPQARLRAATSGDDYELLLAAPEHFASPVPLIPVGRLRTGSGVSLILDGAPVALPERLGYEHGGGNP